MRLPDRRWQRKRPSWDPSRKSGNPPSDSPDAKKRPSKAGWPLPLVFRIREEMCWRESSSVVAVSIARFFDNTVRSVELSKSGCRPTTNDRWTLRPSDLVRARVAPQFIGHDNCFCNLPHGFAGLPALPLQSEIRLLFVDRKITLQNALGAFHDLSRFQLAAKDSCSRSPGGPSRFQLPPETRRSRSAVFRAGCAHADGDAAG